MLTFERLRVVSKVWKYFGSLITGLLNLACLAPLNEIRISELGLMARVLQDRGSILIFQFRSEFGTEVKNSGRTGANIGDT